MDPRLVKPPGHPPRDFSPSVPHVQRHEISSQPMSRISARTGRKKRINEDNIDTGRGPSHNPLRERKLLYRSALQVRDDPAAPERQRTPPMAPRITNPFSSFNAKFDRWDHFPHAAGPVIRTRRGSDLGSEYYYPGTKRQSQRNKTRYTEPMTATENVRTTTYKIVNGRAVPTPAKSAKSSEHGENSHPSDVQPLVFPKPHHEAAALSQTVIHSTISKDHTEGETARTSNLLAGLGQRFRSCTKELLAPPDDSDTGIFTVLGSPYSQKLQQRESGELSEQTKIARAVQLAEQDALIAQLRRPNPSTNEREGLFEPRPPQQVLPAQQARRTRPRRTRNERIVIVDSPPTPRTPPMGLASPYEVTHSRTIGSRADIDNVPMSQMALRNAVQTAAARRGKGPTHDYERYKMSARDPESQHIQRDRDRGIAARLRNKLSFDRVNQR